jgi:cytochrome c5
VFSRGQKLGAFFFLIYAFGAGSGILTAQVPIEVGSRDRSKDLPDTEGKGLVLATCTQCHSLGPVVLQRKSVEGWAKTVRDMISRGAQVRPEEITLISNYLVRSFGQDVPRDTGADKRVISGEGPGVRNAGNVSTSLPEGPMKTIVSNSCAECHGLNSITEQRKDEAGWRATVKDMVRLGAKLEEKDVQGVVSYLVKNFGPQPATGVAAAASSNTVGTPGAKSQSGNLSGALTDGEGKGLILATCVQCHGLQEIVGQRKNAEGWRRTVHDMVSRGAQLTWGEAETVVSYLAQYRGK